MRSALSNIRMIVIALAIGLPVYAAEPPPPDTQARFDPSHPRNAPSEADYPVAARRLNEQGDVILSLLVRADGTIQEVILDQSSGFERLDDAAIEFYYSIPKLLPAVKGGKKVASWKVIKVVWKLKQTAYDAEGNPIIPVPKK